MMRREAKPSALAAEGTGVGERARPGGWGGRGGGGEVRAGVRRGGLAVNDAARAETLGFGVGGNGLGEAAAPEAFRADRVEERAEPRRFRVRPALVVRRELNHGLGQAQALDGELPRLDRDRARGLARRPGAVHESEAPRRLAGLGLE